MSHLYNHLNQILIKAGRGRLELQGRHLSRSFEAKSSHKTISQTTKLVVSPGPVLKFRDKKVALLIEELKVRVESWWISPILGVSLWEQLKRQWWSEIGRVGALQECEESQKVGVFTEVKSNHLVRFGGSAQGQPLSPVHLTRALWSLGYKHKLNPSCRDLTDTQNLCWALYRVHFPRKQTQARRKENTILHIVQPYSYTFLAETVTNKSNANKG